MRAARQSFMSVQRDIGQFRTVDRHLIVYDKDPYYDGDYENYHTVDRCNNTDALQDDDSNYTYNHERRCHFFGV
jgi:hypothetical protein